jgi:hypothetical protein
MATFPQFLTAGDFSAGSTATDISVISGKYNEVGRKTVGAQQIINWGIGVVNNGVDTREYGKIRFDSVAGQIAGKYRLAVTDANAENVIPVLENNDVNFATGTSVKVGFSQPGAKEDSAIVILLKPDTTTTVDYSDSDNVVNLPVTVTTGTR